MADAGFSGITCAAQVGELLALLDRARNLFGNTVVDPPGNFAPPVSTAGRWIR